MILHKTENLLNLSLNKELPEDVIKGLFIRFSGVNAAGVTSTIAQLGSVRVNFRGTDIWNAPVSFVSNFNNLHWGVAEYASAIGGAFVCSIYVPFHVPWDDQNGLVNRISDKGTLQMLFPALTAAVIASGTVEVYYIPARSAATYIPIYMNQNIQIGGAGQVVDRLQSFNISSIYVVTNALVTNVMVFRDGKNIINSNQNTLLAKSNFDNRVETAIATYQLDLNPNKILSNSLSNNLEVQLTATGATALETYYLAILFNNAPQGVVSQEFTPSTRPPLVTASAAIAAR